MTLIPAYSPEARGRSERAFRTLQDRRPKELARAGITDMAAANRYLTERFLPQHNARFMVGATEPGTAFIPGVGPHLAEILCVQEERVVAKDNTVRYQGLSLQIPQDPHRFHYVQVTVRVHAYPDGTLAVFHGPRCLARYHEDGRLIEAEIDAHRHKNPTPRSRARLIVDPRPTCAKYFRRAAEICGRKNRTDHVLEKPDKLTCYLQGRGEEAQEGDRTSQERSGRPVMIPSGSAYGYREEGTVRFHWRSGQQGSRRLKS